VREERVLAITTVSVLAVIASDPLTNLCVAEQGDE
jgi:hypothetical protein